MVLLYKDIIRKVHFSLSNRGMGVCSTGCYGSSDAHRPFRQNLTVAGADSVCDFFVVDYHWHDGYHES